MLNPKLKLNQKIFSENVKLEAIRSGFGKGLFLLGKNRKVVCLSADLVDSTKADLFAKAYPKRFFECGVAEQNMAAISAGLAVCDKIPFISSYSVFSPGKNWETVRTTIIYNNANVKIAGHHAGIITGADGVTHQATEDISSIRAWPNITILSPCDAIEAKKATIAAALIKGPVYIRLSREETPIMTTQDSPFNTNKIQALWVSKNPKVVIFATGHMLYQALLAAKELETTVNVLVANVSTLKPIDKRTVLKLASKTKKVVTCEDHQVAGGLGGIIAEVLSENLPSFMEFIGLKDTFAESGKPKDLLLKYGLSKDNIIKAVKRILIK